MSVSLSAASHDYTENTPKLLRAENRSQRGAARRRDAPDRLTDLVIRRRGAGRHADRERPLRQPRLATLLDLRPHGPEANGPSRGVDAARVLDVEGGDFLLADGGERSEERRVGKECRSRWSPYH